MEKTEFQLKVLTEETRYLMDADDPTLEAFARRLLGQDYNSAKIDCEVCSKSRVTAVLYATQRATGSKVRTFCCMDCGVSTVQTSRKTMPDWHVSLYKLGIEIKMEVEIRDDQDHLDGDGTSVSGPAR
jgi:ferredoxin-like protein FixX